jgi:hypothetical protein
MKSSIKGWNSMAILVCSLFIFLIASCEKDSNPSQMRFFEIGFDAVTTDWRDSSFIIATSNPAIIAQIEAQFALPVSERKMVKGPVATGSGGYNKNGGHEFRWHLKENEITFVDLSAEIYDGRPYSDLDVNLNYWLNSMGQFGPWGSFVRKEIIFP